MCLVCDQRIVWVHSQAWTLDPPLRLPPGDYRVFGEHLLLKGEDAFQLCGADGAVTFSFRKPKPHLKLRAICPLALHFAFHCTETDELVVLRRVGQQLELWRTAPDDWREDGRYVHTIYGGYPPSFRFTPCGRYLAIYAAEETPRLWYLEENRRLTLPGPPLMLPAGGWLVTSDEKLELFDAEGRCVRARPSPPKLLNSFWSTAGFLVLLCQDRVQLFPPGLDSMLAQRTIADIHSATISGDGRTLCLVHYFKGQEDCTQVSLCELPSLASLGPAQAFDPNDLGYLRPKADHGWVVDCQRRAGWWHIASRRFGWLTCPESFLAGINPLPGGKILLFTQDGAWHLYQGLPPELRATLYTAESGSWLVGTPQGAWDASPDLSERVLPPAHRRRPGLWGELTRAQS